MLFSEPDRGAYRIVARREITEPVPLEPVPLPAPFPFTLTDSLSGATRVHR